MMTLASFLIVRPYCVFINKILQGFDDDFGLFLNCEAVLKGEW